MIDNAVWLFGTVAYLNPPSLIVRKFIVTNNIWAIEKILWGLAGLFIWKTLYKKEL